MTTTEETMKSKPSDGRNVLTDGADLVDSREELKAKPELPRLERGKSKGKTDYLVFHLSDGPDRVGVYENWELVAVIACSNADQAIRAANEEFGVGTYAVAGESKWHRETMAEETRTQLRFVR